MLIEDSNIPSLVAQRAEFLYNAYCNHTGWKSAVTGAPLPSWEKVFKSVQDAWIATAAAIDGPGWPR